MSLNQCHSVSDNTLAGVDKEIGQRLEEIELAGCKNIYQSMNRLVQICPNLLKLNLRGVPLICDKILISLADSCPQLECLDLSVETNKCCTTTKSYTPRIGSDGIKAIGASCKNLQVLRLNGCTRVDDSSIISIANGCRGLKLIELRYCHRISSRSIEAIGEHCHDMKQVVFTLCKEIDDRGIVALAVGCPFLEEVDLMGLSLIRDNSIIRMAIMCKLLKRINLRDCYQLSNRSFRAVIELCTHLEMIDMHAVDNLSDASISVLPSYAPYLRTVKVGDSKISDYVLQEISKDMYYSVRVKEQLALEPLHKELKVHEQHKQVSPITVTYKFSQRNLS